MRVRIKKRNMFGMVKVESIVRIDNVSIKENIIEPEKATVELFVKGKDSSGIITLGKHEAESLVGSIRSGMVKNITPEKIGEERIRKKKWHRKTVVRSE